MSPGTYPSGFAETQGNVQVGSLLSRDNILAQFCIIFVMSPEEGEMDMCRLAMNLFVVEGEQPGKIPT
jgi:hypothetical protein